METDHETLTPYPLPAPMIESLLELARDSDVLMLGELHGTQEVPALALALLDGLSGLGYGALALEIPAAQRDALAGWAGGQAESPPRFFTHPLSDGRGNRQALELVRQAVGKPGWQILCFDDTFNRLNVRFAERDRRMAENFLAQRRRFCPDAKVLVICGNFHTRLRAVRYPQYFPSFAHHLSTLEPNLRVSAVNIGFLGGTFFNMTQRKIILVQDITELRPISPPFREPRLQPADEFSITLTLPTATAATFLPPVNRLDGVRRRMVWGVLAAISTVVGLVMFPRVQPAKAPTEH